MQRVVGKVLAFSLLAKLRMAGILSSASLSATMTPMHSVWNIYPFPKHCSYVANTANTGAL